MRKLIDLSSVGPATVRDLKLLGIKNVAQLSKCDAKTLHKRLCEKRKMRIDICMQDIFSAAIAQAKNPRLPARQRDWWYWSRKRKQTK
jgi:nucleotidyltransferase/DNA polymerase involved in DNA repair